MLNHLPAGQARSGRIRSNLKGELAFSSFIPTDLQDIQITYTDGLVKLLGETHRALGALTENWEHLNEDDKRSALERITDGEAEASARMSQDAVTETIEKDASPEGGAELMRLDLLLRPAQEKPLSGPALEDKKWLRDAYAYAQERMEKLPLSLRLVREIHDFVMHAPHNYENKPGEFRYSPVWIGRPGSTLSNASFMPPIPEDMKRGLYRLEEFIHQEDDLDPLIRACLIHYQFETLHPFVDGNGRVGRLLVLLYLIDRGLLPAPVLPLNATLKKLEFQYYIYISLTQTDGEYESMIRFGLNVIKDACLQASGEEVLQ